MSSNELLHLLPYAEIILCVVALYFLIFRGHWRLYWALGMLLLVRATTGLVLLLVSHSSEKAIEKHLAYQIYFYVYWGALAVEILLTLLVLYSVFRVVLEPFRGLQRLGSRIFCGIAILCFALAVFTSFGPHLDGRHLLVAAITQLQNTLALFTICLVLYVFGFTRDVGLSYRGTVFGVTAGLGILAAMELVVTGWLAHSPQMFQQFNFVNAIVVAAVMGLWAAYLALPERGRRTVELPANSLLARWNRTWTGGV
jgi:hypothetical protein